MYVRAACIRAGPRRAHRLVHAVVLGLNFENDERVTSIHAAAVTQASYEENKTATFRIAPQGNTWRNCLDEYTYWNDATVAEVRNNLPLFALSDDHSHGKFRNLVFGFCRWVRLPSRQSRLRSCCRSTLISTW
jgi:hypothetical protein